MTTCPKCGKEYQTDPDEQECDKQDKRCRACLKMEILALRKQVSDMGWEIEFLRNEASAHRSDWI